MMARGDTVRTDNMKVSLDISLWRKASTSSHAALQLPLELLQTVFLFLVEPPSVQASARISSDPTGRPIWIAITYVCRYWRSAALSLRELWSSITSDLSISWSRAMIERSSPLPMHIDIVVDHMVIGSDGLKPPAAPEPLPASRIRTLSLAGFPTDVLKVLNRLCSPSPQESLNLTLISIGSPIDLPESLYGRDAPHLRRLTICSNGSVRAPLWLLAGITHFTNNL
ncbi:hypothetical protein EI94DRAFT_900234 [Lactarius quietus]|nr:hypothetical protein EI94DRAFT_900234 [Lactarius quietus]